MSNEINEQPEVVLPKRKRGRPRKIKPETTDVVVVVDDATDPVATETIVTPQPVEEVKPTGENNMKRKTKRGKRQTIKKVAKQQTVWQRVKSVLTKKVF